METLINALQLHDGGIICFIGAGGKTTLMFNAAEELSRHGETVMTTTTTRIMKPAPEQSEAIILSVNCDEILKKAKSVLKKSLHVTAATGYQDGSLKLTGYEPDIIEKFRESGLFRWILVEADGARQKSLKIPAGHEPVIPECATKVVAVIGLDSIGKPLNDNTVFRPELYSSLTGIPFNEPVTEESIVDAILHEQGILKGCPPESQRYVFFNKADEGSALASGKNLILKLAKQKIAKLNRIILGIAQIRPCVLEWHDMENSDQ